MKLYKLHAAVLRIKNNPAGLLKGVTTNTTDASKTAFIDRFGKIIVTCHQLKLSEGESLLIIEQQFYNRLLKHLEPYLRLVNTTVHKEDYNVYFDLDGKYQEDREEFVLRQKTGKLLVTKKRLNNTVSDEEFTLFRIKNSIPVQGIDYDAEMILNISEEFVSFTKGCFLGQEVVARVHNLGKPPKKLVVKAEDECNEEEKAALTSRCFDQATGKTLGFVLVRNT